VLQQVDAFPHSAQIIRKTPGGGLNVIHDTTRLTFSLLKPARTQCPIVGPCQNGADPCTHHPISGRS
jgi:hypothetical protein